MSAIDYRNILLRPHISEKSTKVAEAHNQYVFRVVKQANKKQIKYAIQKLFDVEVQAVQVVNTKPEVKKNARGVGIKKGFKKAYVSVKKGQEITFNPTD